MPVHLIWLWNMLVTQYVVFQLLSEEVFDFSRGEMTQQKIKDLKQSLNR
jgi:hypothetical protein